MALADAKGAFLINERSQQTYSRARYIHLRFAFVLRVPLNNPSIGSPSILPPFPLLYLRRSLFFSFYSSSLLFVPFYRTRATILIPRSDACEIFRKSSGNDLFLFFSRTFSRFESFHGYLFEREPSVFGEKFSKVKEFLNKSI